MQDLGSRLLADIPQDVMIEMFNKNSSLRGYVQGYAAEELLMKQLREVVGMSEIEKIPDRSKRKGDISLIYNGRPLTIEVKSLIVGSDRPDYMNGGFSAVTIVKKTDRATDTEEAVGTCHLPVGEFDILAISTYSITRTWEYYFIANKFIPRAESDQNKLKTSIRVNITSTPFLHSDILKAIADLS